jgi:hypothetical protein
MTATGLSAIRDIVAAAHWRAERYREHAKELLELAETEPSDRLRKRLMDLAHDYAEVAAMVRAVHDNWYCKTN